MKEKEERRGSGGGKRRKKKEEEKKRGKEEREERKKKKSMRGIWLSRRRKVPGWPSLAGRESSARDTANRSSRIPWLIPKNLRIHPKFLFYKIENERRKGLTRGHRQRIEVEVDGLQWLKVMGSKIGDGGSRNPRGAKVKSRWWLNHGRAVIPGEEEGGGGGGARNGGRK